MFATVVDTPWKGWNDLRRWLVWPYVRILFRVNGISWGQGWRLYGIPIVQKHRGSHMILGSDLQLRSAVRSNPLAPNHPVVLCTWHEGALLQVGSRFAMTGGTLCAAERITIGERVTVGANSIIVDNDFHPMDPEVRQRTSSGGKTLPVTIEDDAFIGMNCLILKGVTIGQGSVIGAGSVVTRDVPPHTVVAGNPANALG
jgi:acetyltransferase-like isoleucine patch superfamily enzyme